MLLWEYLVGMLSAFIFTFTLRTRFSEVGFPPLPWHAWSASKPCIIEMYKDLSLKGLVNKWAD